MCDTKYVEDDFVFYANYKVYMYQREAFLSTFSLSFMFMRIHAVLKLDINQN